MLELTPISGDIPGKFTFVTEDGAETMTYRDYLKRDDLLECMADKSRMRIPMGRRIFTYSRAALRGDSNLRKLADELFQEYTANRLQYFLPSGAEAFSFLNGDDANLDIVYGPTRSGKTTTAFVKLLLRCIPTDPKWPLFADHGVKWREWGGPQTVGIATYQSEHLRNVIWPQIIRKWIPESELGQWKNRGPNFNLSVPTIELPCGLVMHLFTYSQSQEVYESIALDGFQWDEQGTEDKFDGANDRLRTTGGWHIFGLTPHVLPDRPDTGSNGWIHRVWKGEINKGCTVSRHMLSLKDVPDWVFPEKSKNAAYQQHIVEAEASGNKRKIRAGRARVFGEPEEFCELIWEDFDKAHHVITAFEIPREWPRWRSMDHGNRGPTTCLFWTVDPNGIRIVYDCYYKENLSAQVHAGNIVKQSGNELRYVGQEEIEVGTFMPVYEEIETKEGGTFVSTVLDSRCYAKKSGVGVDINQLYRKGGLNCQPASGLDFHKSRAFVDDLLRIDTDKKNPYTGAQGCPGILFFDVPNMQVVFDEIDHYVYERGWSETEDKVPISLPKRKIPDHAMDALRYGAQVNMVFEEVAVPDGDNDWKKIEDDNEESNDDNGRDPVTGY